VRREITRAVCALTVQLQLNDRYVVNDVKKRLVKRAGGNNMAVRFVSDVTRVV
jgi:hypothetical protein